MIDGFDMDFLVRMEEAIADDFVRREGDLSAIELALMTIAYTDLIRTRLEILRTTVLANNGETQH